jgi:hypothetical protein
MLGVAGFAAVADYPSQRPVWPLVFKLLFLPSKLRCCYGLLSAIANFAAIVDYFIANTTDYNLNS